MLFDVRGVIGNYIWSWMVGGFKGLRFALSAKYRRRVRRYWSDYPSRRSRGIRQMVIGGALDVFLVTCVLLVVVAESLR